MEIFREQKPDQTKKSFEAAVKRAFKDAGLWEGSVKYGELSAVQSDGRTAWDHIRDDGKLSYNDGTVACDMDMGRVIYLEIKK